MTTEMEKIYEPQQVESKWYDYWLSHNFFTAVPDDSRRPFTIVIPPPNVTGSLHMGHALNNTMQDITIRFRRMQGMNALWVPGTDHGGIATQNVVEKMLKAEGTSRHEIGREKFLERMWQWRRESGDTILLQLRKLGSSLDWSRTRFTMDEQCSRAVVAAFVSLFKEGLIYRGKRLVNWCPRCHTALADIEVEHEEEIGKLWHIRYPVAGKKDEYIVVATTRPETMLGDTAVAVHPEDQRYAALIGKKLTLPLSGREIPVVADAAVDPTFGTGAVKVTPAHDPTDFEIGMRHNLPKIEVIDFHGMMTTLAGAGYAGLERYAARKKVLEDLEAQGLLLETADHPHAVGRCYRCSTVIEPLLSEQWFLKVEEMSRAARQVVEEGKLKFYPSSWAKPYLLWLENLKDWCISRQIWWGHRIPVYYCRRKTKGSEKPCPPIVAEARPGRCPACGGTEIVQDEDVLDTWFSSALWPFSVFGWPQESAGTGKPSDLDYFYPTAVLVTGHEILYLWVARMVQMGLKFQGKIPFSEVFIHGIVRDRHGKKMSKSLGNVIDPLDIMAKYGTDALRFALTQSAAPGRDMQLSEDSFVSARNFANKIWNASRFVLMNARNIDWGEHYIMSIWPLEPADAWILTEYRTLVMQVTEAYNQYNMDLAARLLYEFFWSKYCDWYIEMAKIRINGADDQARKVVVSVLLEVLAGVLRLLHPIMPFITEEIWQSLTPFVRKHGGSGSIMTAAWPEVDQAKIDASVVEEMSLLQNLVSALRTVRSEMNVPPGKTVDAWVNIPDDHHRDVIERYSAYLKALGKIGNLEIGASLPRPAQSAMAVTAGMEAFVPLAGLIDLVKERTRLEKDLAAAKVELDRCGQKLGNADFMQHAPEKEIAKITERQQQARMKCARIEDTLASLS